MAQTHLTHPLVSFLGPHWPELSEWTLLPAAAENLTAPYARRPPAHVLVTLTHGSERLDC